MVNLQDQLSIFPVGIIFHITVGHIVQVWVDLFVVGLSIHSRYFKFNSILCGHECFGVLSQAEEVFDFCWPVLLCDPFKRKMAKSELCLLFYQCQNTYFDPLKYLWSYVNDVIFSSYNDLSHTKCQHKIIYLIPWESEIIHRLGPSLVTMKLVGQLGKNDLRVQSNLCTTTISRDPKFMALVDKWSLFRGSSML